MASSGAFYPFRLWTAFALFAVLAAAVFGYGATDRWLWNSVVLAVCALAAAWAARRLLGPYPFVRTWFYAPPLILSGVAGVQLLLGFGADPYATADAFAFWTALSAWLILLVNALDDAALRHRFLQGLPWLAGAAASWALVIRYVGPVQPELFRRAPSASAFGGFARGSHFIFLMEMLFPAAVYLAVEQRGRWKWAYVLLSGMIAAAVLASGSTTGALVLAAELLAILAAYVVMGVRSSSRRRRARMLVSAAGLAVGAVAVVVAGGAYELLTDDTALVSAVAAERDVVGMSRSVAARGVLSMFWSSPLLGHGAGAFGAAFPAYAPLRDGNYWNHAQNDPLELGAEMGVLGFGAQILLVLLIVGRRRSSRAWLTAALPLAAVWVHSLVDFPLRTPALPLTAMALLALIPTDAGVAVGRPRRGAHAPSPDRRDEAPAET